MNPFIVGTVVALNNVPEKDRDKAALALMVYFGIFALLVGGMGAIFALLGV